MGRMTMSTFRPEAEIIVTIPVTQRRHHTISPPSQVLRRDIRCIDARGGAGSGQPRSYETKWKLQGEYLGGAGEMGSGRGSDGEGWVGGGWAFTE